MHYLSASFCLIKLYLRHLVCYLSTYLPTHTHIQTLGCFFYGSETGAFSIEIIFQRNDFYSIYSKLMSDFSSGSAFDLRFKKLLGSLFFALCKLFY